MIGLAPQPRREAMLKGASMRLKLIAAAFVIAASPLAVQAQNAPKPTKAAAQQVVKTISADPAKVKIYCEISKLNDQIDAADEKKDSKKIEALSNQVDDLAEKLGPEYASLTDGLDDMDANSKEAREISAVFDELDDKCGD